MERINTQIENNFGNLNMEGFTEHGPQQQTKATIASKCSLVSQGFIAVAYSGYFLRHEGLKIQLHH